MITVAAAARLILDSTHDFGTEQLRLSACTGRVLAEDLYCDRDLPACNRSTMDGIAVCFSDMEAGICDFTIIATIAAGSPPVSPTESGMCVELMTGAPVPDGTDTVIRYEDIIIVNGVATVKGVHRRGQNIHRKGADKQQGALLIKAGTVITADVTGAAATIGAANICVRRLPRIIVISTGDELVDVAAIPSDWQVRRSNSHAIAAVLQQYGIYPQLLHLPDDPVISEKEISSCLENYDVLLLSGGVSMGKFDYLPAALNRSGVTEHFHKVLQRPGKPFWFGSVAGGPVVFAFPGNPVSSFMCLHRYFLPWLKQCLGMEEQKIYAVLDADLPFQPELTWFVQVSLQVSASGMLTASPLQGNGSGDLANLLGTSAFMELPAEKTTFNKGEVYPVWPFKPIG